VTDFDLLVVDDEPVVAGAARRVLEPEGLTVDAVEGAAEAVDRLRRQRYGLVLLDLVLPGVSGLELLDEVVARYGGTPVIVTTGFASSRNGVEVLSAGAFDFLPKPFDIAELLGVVRRCRRFLARMEEGESFAECVDRLRRDRGDLYYLGAHSWARIEEGGVAALGLAETFFGGLGESPSVSFPTLGAETLQGRSLVHIECTDGGVHRVWAPLSGRVVGGNPRLEAEPALLQTSPLGEGWLVRIAPTNEGEELSELNRW
jgi:CheY-like chemotaxis protein